MDPPKIFSGQHHARPKGNKSQTLRSGIVSIDIPAGKDVVQWLFEICCRRKVSLTVSRGSGQLSDVILRGQQRPIVGPFRMDSLSGYVTLNSPESFFPFQVTLGGPDGRLCTTVVVGGTASTTVKVTAMMTVLQDLENTPSTSNSSPRIMNVQSSECYNQKDEDDMKSKNDELDDDFWNSLSPIVDLSPFERV